MQNKNKLVKYFYFFYYTKKLSILFRFFSYFFRPFSHFIITRLKPSKKEQIFNLIILDNYVQDNMADKILNNNFNFLGIFHDFKDNIHWFNNNQNDLWNFNLNYFEYLSDLYSKYEECGNGDFIKKAEHLILHWVNCSNKYNRIMWSPYTTSLRLINWISFYSKLLKIGYIKSIPPDIINSIKKQLSYLRLNLEYDVNGNHLFENYKAILLSDYFLNNKINLNKNVKKLNYELSRQILFDGCHFEKSISYHIVVLNGILDILSLIDLPLNSLNSLRYYANEMYRFYKNISYNNLEYPLLSDSNYSITKKINFELINEKYKKISTDTYIPLIKLKKHSNYYVYLNNQLRLTMDLGDLGSNYLLAHSHNDIFNFELLVNNKKFIIDTGVYDYQDSPERQYSRSTKAHNTIQIDNLEQSDIWRIFRNGYRPTMVDSNHKKHEHYENFQGIYKYKNIYNHKRSFKITTKNTICVIDQIYSKKNLPKKLYLHFDPEVKVLTSNKYFRLVNQDTSLYLYFFDNKKLILVNDIVIFETYYFPYFGLKRKRKSIIYHTNNNFLGFIITFYKINNFTLDNDCINLIYENGNTEKMGIRL
jgi:hypothetical protein